MGQLYRLPNGKVVELYKHKTFRIVGMCPRCGRWMTKWHEHLTEEGETITATSEWVRKDG